MKETVIHTDKQPKFIDVEKVFASKNPRLSRFIPGFVFRKLKKIIHQEEINDFVLRNGKRFGFDFVSAIVTEFGAIIKTEGEENIPVTGGCIMVSNHPLGALDAMGLLDIIGRKRKDVKFLVNDILMNLDNLNELFMPVNKHGKNTTDMLQEIESIYSSGKLVLIFPAGLVSRKQKGGIIKDLDWKKSFITRAKKHKKNIIPVYIEGRNTDFFYNLANWRKRLGIAANIEMLWLPGEMFKYKNKIIKYIFGKPIPYTVFDHSYRDSEWAKKVKEHVYALFSGKKENMLPTVN
jgi:putative hemolysin